MKKNHYLIIFFILLSFNGFSCEWEKGKPLDGVIHKKFKETSSLQAPFRGCLSSSKKEFYLAEDGAIRRIYKNKKKIKIPGLAVNGDLEDMSIGPCPNGNSRCIYLAYIGNNKIFLLGQMYRKLKVAIVEFETRRLIEIISIRYQSRKGSGSHVADAEAFSVHPVSGDWLLVTKFPPSRVYRLKRGDVLREPQKIKIMKYLGFLDFSNDPVIRGVKKESLRSNYQKITGMDISPDGTKFALVSYGKAYEFSTDLSKVPLGGESEEGLNWGYKIIDLQKLPQTEAISYIDCGKGLAYASERNKKKKSDRLAHLVHTLKCRAK